MVAESGMIITFFADHTLQYGNLEGEWFFAYVTVGQDLAVDIILPGHGEIRFYFKYDGIGRFCINHQDMHGCTMTIVRA